jgi:L-alanine-DL-glutamate epimerase-like enolase superfamily enzyme
MVEYYFGTDPTWRVAFKTSLELIDGELSAPDLPGLGVELHESSLAPHRLL